MNKRIYLLKSGERIRWQGNHHGFVLVYAGRNRFGQRCYEIRKPNSGERRGIVFAYIWDHADEYIKVSFLSAKLGVSERTIQSDIAYLEKQGVLRRVAVIGNDHRQRPNRFECIPIRNARPSMATMENLYKPSNPASFRTWSWDDFKMNMGKSDQELFGQYMELLDEEDGQADRRTKTLRKKIRGFGKEGDGPEM